MTGVGGSPCAAVLHSCAQAPLPFDLFTSLPTCPSKTFFFTDLCALYSQACIYLNACFLPGTKLLSQVNSGSQWLEALRLDSPEVRCQLSHYSYLYTLSFFSLQARGSVGCSIPLSPSSNLLSVLVGKDPAAWHPSHCGMARVNCGGRNCLAGRTESRTEEFYQGVARE
jgi:hypothetical protein